jgi:hypothetical protein
MELALGLLTAGALKLEPLVTDRRPAARAAAVDESLVPHPEEPPGVLLDWRGE